MRNISIDRYDTRGACFKISSDHVNHLKSTSKTFIHDFSFLLA